MDSFEHNMKKMLSRAQSYTLTEYFYERNKILDEINKMKKHINAFSLYCPSHSIQWEEDESIDL